MARTINRCVGYGEHPTVHRSPLRQGVPQNAQVRMPAVRQSSASASAPLVRQLLSAGTESASRSPAPSAICCDDPEGARRRIQTSGMSPRRSLAGDMRRHRSDRRLSPASASCERCSGVLSRMIERSFSVCLRSRGRPGRARGGSCVPPSRQDQRSRDSGTPATRGARRCRRRSGRPGS